MKVAKFIGKGIIFMSGTALFLIGFLGLCIITLSDYILKPGDILFVIVFLGAGLFLVSVSIFGWLIK